MKQFVLPFNPVVDTDQSLQMVLDEQSSHYLIRVRRYRVDDTIKAISPDGRFFDLTFEKVKANSCTVILTPSERLHEDTRIRITLMPALLGSKKMDLVIRQSVECGVHAILPVQTRHSTVNYQSIDKPVKVQRWKRIAKEALQQCGGTYETDIKMPAGLTEALAEWKKQDPIFFLHQEYLDNNGFLHQNPKGDFLNIAIIVGPEGGFSRNELERFIAIKAISVWLGQRILRSETAVIYGIASIKSIIMEKKFWQQV